MNSQIVESRANLPRERKLIFIMTMHLLVAWSLSVWSYSGTGSGEAVRNFFRFASGTIHQPTGYNWAAIFLAPALLLIGGFAVHYGLRRWYR